MNKFEDHWRKKIDSPGEQKDFLTEEGRAAIWEKIQASKRGFEQSWQKKTDGIGAWEGALTEAARQALWHKLQAPLTQFEQQWREKMEEGSQKNGLFLDGVTKERIAATVFVEKENFELDWQDKMNNSVLAGQAVLDETSKSRIWHKVQSGNTADSGSVGREKQRRLPALRWSNAAALLIAAFATWLIRDRNSTFLNSTIVVTNPPEQAIPAVKPPAMQSEKTAEREETAQSPHNTSPRQDRRTIAKVKSATLVKESRKRIESVAGNISPVKALQVAAVLADGKQAIANSNTTSPEIKTNTVAGNPEMEIAINKAAPAKRVVHISDIRPAEVSSKGTAIYGRAFGEGKEKRNEKSTMTFNSVLKNYK